MLPGSKEGELEELISEMLSRTTHVVRCDRLYSSLTFNPQATSAGNQHRLLDLALQDDLPTDLPHVSSSIPLPCRRSWKRLRLGLAAPAFPPSARPPLLESSGSRLSRIRTSAFQNFDSCLPWLAIQTEPIRSRSLPQLV